LPKSECEDKSSIWSRGGGETRGTERDVRVPRITYPGLRRKNAGWRGAVGASWQVAGTRGASHAKEKARLERGQSVWVENVGTCEEPTVMLSRAWDLVYIAPEIRAHPHACR
jgi:hypothetical protein